MEEIHVVGPNTRVNFTGLQHKMLYKHIVCRKNSHAIVVIANNSKFVFACSDINTGLHGLLHESE